MSFPKIKWPCSDDVLQIDSAKLRNELRGELLYGTTIRGAKAASDHAVDALAYARMSPDAALLNYRRRQAIIKAHPEWTEEQVDAHYELTRPLAS